MSVSPSVRPCFRASVRPSTTVPFVCLFVAVNKRVFFFAGQSVQFSLINATNLRTDLVVLV